MLLYGGNYIVEKFSSHDLLAAVSCEYCRGTCNGYDQQVHPMTIIIVSCN